LIAPAAVAAAVSLLAPAAPGASAARPPVALSASPTRLTLLGATRQAIRVVNAGTGPVVVDVAPAGFGIGMRGQPRIVARGADARSAAAWLVIRPKRVVLPAGGSASVSVASSPPPRAAPGDHAALVLLTTRARPGGIGVRMRIGVAIVLRIPGTIVHRLELRSLRVATAGPARVLRLVVANSGNVIESLAPGRLEVTLLARNGPVARLRPRARELLPRTTGSFDLRCPAGLHGWVMVRVALTSARDGRATLRRSFRVRL
jgi:hypothetical protein